MPCAMYIHDSPCISADLWTMQGFHAISACLVVHALAMVASAIWLLPCICFLPDKRKDYLSSLSFSVSDDSKQLSIEKPSQRPLRSAGTGGLCLHWCHKRMLANKSIVSYCKSPPSHQANKLMLTIFAINLNGNDFLPLDFREWLLVSLQHPWATPSASKCSFQQEQALDLSSQRRFWVRACHGPDFLRSNYIIDVSLFWTWQGCNESSCSSYSQRNYTTNCGRQLPGQ